MRSIPLETLRLNLSKELANLKVEPIQITKRGEPIGYLVLNLKVEDVNLKEQTTNLKVEKQPCVSKPVPEIVAPESSGSVNKPATKQIIKTVADIPAQYQGNKAVDLRAKYKAAHPLDICNGCRQFNRNCTCYNIAGQETGRAA